MSDLNEIIHDLNISIADVETVKADLGGGETKNDFTRAIGQLKAARASLIQARKVVQTVTSKES